VTDIALIRQGAALTSGQQVKLTVMLASPAILSQLSSIMMEYIDASMVGRLGADDSAAIGLVATSLWLFWGVCTTATQGFTVQVAHRAGANDWEGARRVLRQSVVACLALSLAVAAVGAAIAFPLPYWLGGTEEIAPKASIYFLGFVLALPLLTMTRLAGGMLRSVGNMKVPSALNVLMCVLDCLFNYLFIFPTHTLHLGSLSLTLPGAGLGVLGAALGTVVAEAVTAVLMGYFLFVRQKDLRLWGTHGSMRPTRNVMRMAVKIAVPMTVEHAVICGAQIATTMIVAPLGVFAIAANSFAVTAESLCYMPGYGIGDAATTLVGQSYGARRPELVRRFGLISVGLGMAVMSLMGVLLYVGAPWAMAVLSPVEEIQRLGTEVLRIEAWAEPMFAASIVAYGVFVGVGRTMVPALMNFGSIWLVRLPLAALLARTYGLRGVWMAMCVELIFRGVIFLIKLLGTKWYAYKTGK
jgi:putative MATE family efflux protein